jgi:hypothetical protein
VPALSRLLVWIVKSQIWWAVVLARSSVVDGRGDLPLSSARDQDRVDRGRTIYVSRTSRPRRRPESAARSGSRLSCAAWQSDRLSRDYESFGLMF